MYSEKEPGLALETAKRAARRRVYASQYLDFADKYFGAHLNADARRCYKQAVRYQLSVLMRAGVARRFAATLIGREFYEQWKRKWNWRSQTPEVHSGELPEA